MVVDQRPKLGKPDSRLTERKVTTFPYTFYATFSEHHWVTEAAPRDVCQVDPHELHTRVHHPNQQDFC